MSNVKIEPVEPVANLRRQQAHLKQVIAEETEKLKRLKAKLEGKVKSKGESIKRAQAELARVDKDLAAAEAAKAEKH